jgi:hypothetical protein
MSHKPAPFIAVHTIGIDLGKNSFHLVGLGGSRARSRLSAKGGRRKCRLTKARSGPPTGCLPPLCATIAHLVG